MHDLPDAGWDVPGWMLAKIVNDYFAGWEPITLGATDEEFHETVNESLRIASCATQTDFCHVGFSGPTEAKEAAPECGLSECVVWLQGVITRSL